MKNACWSSDTFLLFVSYLSLWFPFTARFVPFSLSSPALAGRRPRPRGRVQQEVARQQRHDAVEACGCLVHGSFQLVAVQGVEDNHGVVEKEAPEDVPLGLGLWGGGDGEMNGLPLSEAGGCVCLQK